MSKDEQEEVSRASIVKQIAFNHRGASASTEPNNRTIVDQEHRDGKETSHEETRRGTKRYLLIWRWEADARAVLTSRNFCRTSPRL